MLVRILFLIVLFGESSHAFINIESLRQNIEKGFNGSTGLSLSGASGNVDVFRTGLNSLNIYKDNKREYIFTGMYNYGEAQGIKNNNKGNFHLRYAQSFSKGMFWEAFSQAEFNEFQALTLRVLGGGGLRFCLLRGEEQSVFLGAGTFYEDEDIKNDTDQANFRGNIYLSYRAVIEENLESVLVAYYQPNYNVINDYRLQLTAGFETKINKWIQLVNDITFSRDTVPPRAIERDDFVYKLVFNVSY